MNLALWKKAVSESWMQLVISAVGLCLFAWLFVWLMSLFKLGAFAAILSYLPSFVEKAFGIPLDKMASTNGRLSVLYVHIITILVCVGWAAGRGSSTISGEIGRGTMDLLLSLPVRRASILIAPAVVTTLGAAVLAASLWTGCWLGLKTIELESPGSPWALLPGAINLFSLIVCIAGLTTLISSLCPDRWRTVLYVGGLYIVSLVLELTSRLWDSGSWLAYFSFLAAYRPQDLILMDEAKQSALHSNLTLLGIGLAGYLLAAIILSCRDVPASR